VNVLLRAIRTASGCALHRDGAGDSFDDAREFDQGSIAGGLDDPSPVLGGLFGRSLGHAA
jgi:hypothetical protein